MNSRLVMLHGWGATSDDLEPLGRSLAAAIDLPLEVVALAAPHLHPQPPGRQWYGLFPAEWDAVPAAVEALQERLKTITRQGPSMERTVLLGFSQGGAMALSSGCSLPLAGVISCSGYPHPNWQPADEHPPVLVMHGRQDTIVPPTAMDSITERLRSDRCETISFDSGHTIPEETVQPMLTFLKRVLKGS